MTTSRGTALITGASSGIGLATAAALADDGWHVVATARNPSAADALGELAAERPNIQLRELDVTRTVSVSGCVDAVLAERGAIELLVNNAGAGRWRPPASRQRPAPQRWPGRYRCWRR